MKPIAPPIEIQSTARKAIHKSRSNKDRGLDRPFIAWDGEGWTDESGAHHYCLFGSSVDPGIEGESLSTLQCFTEMLGVAYYYPHAIHVGFAFEYDVNMILRDVKYLNLRELKETTRTTWRGYKIEHMPKKWFQVSGMYMGKWVTCRIQDVFTFFASSFVKALKAWDVGNDETIRKIEEGKEARGGFSLAAIDDFVRPYWRSELDLLVQLADRLRDNLFAAGIRPTGWYGPGAVASALYSSHDSAQHIDRELDPRIIDAAAGGYAGGRFETFQAGLYEGPVYSADINSAYPAAMSHLPSIQHGHWEHSTDEEYIRNLNRPLGMGLYYVRFNLGDWGVNYQSSAVPYPKFHRFHHGGVGWPVRSEGWVFEPEFQVLNSPRFRDHMDVWEAWIFHDEDVFPFEWVEDMYRQRKEWKRAGNQAQLALKLGINSLYGKLAQRTGWNQDTFEPPKFHQLEYAGWITSYCRAMIQMAAFSIGGAGLISIETDGIYSTQPITKVPGGMGDELGQWEPGEYTGILYLQNGIYWLRDMNGDWQKPKTRGIPQKQLNIDSALASLITNEPLKASQTSFIGYGLSMHHSGSKMKDWRRWIEGSKEFKFGGDGKRLHDQHWCKACRDGRGYDDGLHQLRLMLTTKEDRKSHPHTLPWANADLSIKKEIQAHDRWEIEDV